MSTETHDGHAGSVPHGTKQSYMTGFVLSVILTTIPFAVVMSGGFASARLTAFLVLAFAVVQIIVHMIYFLHMSMKSESGWTMTAMIFTVIVLVIAIVGTIWVMYNMDANMMPGMAPTSPAS